MPLHPTHSDRCRNSFIRISFPSHLLTILLKGSEHSEDCSLCHNCKKQKQIGALSVVSTVSAYAQFLSLTFPGTRAQETLKQTGNSRVDRTSVAGRYTKKRSSIEREWEEMVKYTQRHDKKQWCVLKTNHQVGKKKWYENCMQSREARAAMNGPNRQMNSEQAMSDTHRGTSANYPADGEQYQETAK